jgi:hypothetical protein
VRDEEEKEKRAGSKESSLASDAFEARPFRAMWS